VTGSSSTFIRRYQRWTEVLPTQPDLRVHICVDLTSVADGELLDGVMRVTGQLPDGVEPFETRFRVEFHDHDRREPDPVFLIMANSHLATGAAGLCSDCSPTMTVPRGRSPLGVTTRHWQGTPIEWRGVGHAPAIASGRVDVPT
jgi:hypothetical protein